MKVVNPSALLRGQDGGGGQDFLKVMGLKW